MPIPPTNLPNPASAATRAPAASSFAPSTPAPAAVAGAPLASSPLASALLAAATVYLDNHDGQEGYFSMPMGGVHVLHCFRRVMANHRVYKPSLCIVLRGAKQIVFGGDMLAYGPMQCLIVSMDMPACGQIVEASPDESFVGITIDLDPAVMHEVIEQMDAPPVAPADAGPALFVESVDAPLAECLLRLFRLADQPQAAPVLHPSIMREIYYWLLSGPHGGELRRQVQPDTHNDRIVKAISLLRANYTQRVRVEQLADVARMSPSSFHQHFKAMTSMTPLQFQKQLRLLEARRLMVAEAAGVADAAYQVGYESASQFSREYSRMFGASPKRSAMELRATMA